LCTVKQNTAVKVYHAKKTLQLFDVLRGWAIFDFGSVIGVGARPVAKILCPRISREGVAKTHFSKLMASPLAAKAVKKPPNGRGLCACLENRLMSRPCITPHPPDQLWCDIL
jgi:hypothetical protein